jgi:hypothetical protein
MSDRKRLDRAKRRAVSDIFNQSDSCSSSSDGDLFLQNQNIQAEKADSSDDDVPYVIESDDDAAPPLFDLDDLGELSSTDSDPLIAELRNAPSSESEQEVQTPPAGIIFEAPPIPQIETPLSEKLNSWYLSHDTHCHASYSDLLAILQPYHPELAKCAKTALKTQNSTCHVPMENFQGLQGYYAYFGLVNRLTSIASRCMCFYEFLSNCKEIVLLFSTDGAPLFKNSKNRLGFWPLSVKIMSKAYNIDPIVFGLFVGTSKPSSSFMRDTTRELAKICKVSISILDLNVSIKLLGVSADSPARSYLKAIKYANAKHGCERCDSQSSKLGNKMCYGISKGTPRSGILFRRKKYLGTHQTGKSLMYRIKSLDHVKQFFLDPLHLTDEGVSKRLYEKLFLPGLCKDLYIGALNCNALDVEIDALDKIVPREFQTPLVKTKHFSQWKGSTFRDFTMYFGSILLKKYLAPNVYKWYLKFVVGLKILRSRELCCDPDMLDKAERLLTEFSDDWDSIVGEPDRIYCVHNLRHLTDDVRSTGLPLDDISTYCFESYYGKLKKMIKSSKVPIAQMEKRIYERDSVFQLYKIFRELPTVIATKNEKVQKVAFKYLKLGIGDFCFSDKKKVLKIVDISLAEEKIVLNCTELTIVKPQFTIPEDSSLIFNYIVRYPTPPHFVTVKLKKIKCQLYCYPHKDNDFVVMGAAHTC